MKVFIYTYTNRAYDITRVLVRASRVIALLMGVSRFNFVRVDFNIALLFLMFRPGSVNEIGINGLFPMVVLNQRLFLLVDLSYSYYELSKIKILSLDLILKIVFIDFKCFQIDILCKNQNSGPF